MVYNTLKTNYFMPVYKVVDKERAKNLLISIFSLVNSTYIEFISII